MQLFENMHGIIYTLYTKILRMEDHHYENAGIIPHPYTRPKVAGAYCSRIRLCWSQFFMLLCLPRSEEARNTESAEEILSHKQQHMLYQGSAINPRK